MNWIESLLKKIESGNRKILIGLLVSVSAAVFAIILLIGSILERKAEAKDHVFRVVNLTEDTVDPAEWGKNFPRQYDSYKRTVDIERTKHGGSEAFQKLDDDPLLRELFAGYAFGVDFREERGHAYMLQDQNETERVKQFKQPGACLHCHASVIPFYKSEGKKAGVPDDQKEAQIQKGFDLVCAMSYKDAAKNVKHPVSCVDCHNVDSMQLEVNRPGFINGIRNLAKSSAPTPHLPSIERWRKEGKKGEYDVNKMASRQEMRSFVCGQCHVEYYFKGPEKNLTYPWHNGLKMEQIEKYYDDVAWKDFEHKKSGAKVLKAQHPEFETWSQGIHARSGVSCADCHMPYKREGAIKISDHHVRSPMLNVAASCETCHRYPEKEIKARVEIIQDRTKELLLKAEGVTVSLIKDIEAAKGKGASDASLESARDFHRKAQWRVDFVAAENSMGFHAPGESLRILAEAIDYARQGQLNVQKIGK
ncbi:MAG TPA: ammonia-forming cytochrome c nitrite reductase subunit c552 [Leptospiraceae bacterium]|nr:ammonia-forming cytochrome c nitrite reductase subunit c552 [Leptospiraceae bacterium]HRG73527.1 ammonia-forming cytochrome c nitrite reductase subunit c552 [Leptospiraceae bacterium]